MRKLTRLWQALERIPGLCDIPAYWQDHCGVDYPLIHPHLQLTDDFGARYPCPHPQDGHCPRSIVDYGDGSFSAVCRHPHRLCEDLPLSTKDALVYRLDVDGIVRPMAEALCIRGQILKARAHGVWELGLSTSRTTRNHPAFLLVFTGSDDFGSAIRKLALSCPTPFVAVAPTGNHLTVELREHLDRRQSEGPLSPDGRNVGRLWRKKGAFRGSSRTNVGTPGQRREKRRGLARRLKGKDSLV